MTPDEARDLLDGTTPGDEWYYRVKWGAVQYIEPVTVIPGGEVDVAEDDAALIVAAPEMAAMIAGMREEWVGQYLDRDGKWGTICAYPTRDEVARHLDYLNWDEFTHTRLVRRYVTEPEEA